ncbi:MAG: CXXX repeat peptide modification system protein [Alistipes sp.]|nr:CXXX repeat peptide modification system protein [Alistipes sp.]MDE7129464.1 CXXX repeat peptide modification system protein [Alistipes sp.]
MKKLVGKVTVEERNEIRSLFERRNGLAELAKIIGDDETLYERLVTDMGTTGARFQQWWDKMAEKYDWEQTENGSWQIDFDSCEIYLTE